MKWNIINIIVGTGCLVKLCLLINAKYYIKWSFLIKHKREICQLIEIACQGHYKNSAENALVILDKVEKKRNESIIFMLNAISIFGNKIRALGMIAKAVDLVQEYQEIFQHTHI